ncbi:MAG: hypothetical protein ABSE73_24985 [Planctomycetota bacterium]
MAESSRRSTRFSMRSKQLGQLLLENGDVGAEQIAQALKLQEQRGGLLGQILRELEACSMQAIQAALLKQVQVTDVKCEELLVAAEVADMVPRELCDAERLCPFEKLGGMLCVVMGNPLNRKAILLIEDQAKLKVKSFKAPWPKIHELIERTYGGSAPETAGELPGPSAPAGPDAGPAPEPPVEEAPGPPAPEEAPPGAGEVVAEAAPPRATGSGRPLAHETPAMGSVLPVGPPAVPEARQRSIQAPEPAPGAKVEGLDELDESRAEMIVPKDRKSSYLWINEATKPQVQKEARANVDLDKLDLGGAGALAVPTEGEEAMEEVAPAAPLRAPPRRASMAGMAELKAVPDSHFFAEGTAPEGERSEELLDLLASLPVADTVAESIGDYEARTAAQGAAAAAPAEPAALASRLIELEPAPGAPVAAAPLSEDEFKRATAGLVEDPAGEWEWQYAAQGPLQVVPYDGT